VSPGSTVAPDVEARDHRTVGFGFLRGADAALSAVEALRRLSEAFEDRFDNVLGLAPDVLLVRARTAADAVPSGRQSAWRHNERRAPHLRENSVGLSWTTERIRRS
jgi:hypothetical protein